MNESTNNESARVALRWYRAAILYLTVAVILGVVMGVQENFLLRSVHAHVSLLGWVTLAVTGLIYHHWPQLGANLVARTHFWLHNGGLVAMAGGLGATLLGYVQAQPLIGLGSVLVASAVALFAFNFVYGTRAPATPDQASSMSRNSVRSSASSNGLTRYPSAP